MRKKRRQMTKIVYMTSVAEGDTSTLDRAGIASSEKPFDIKVLRQDVDKYIKSDSELIKLSQKIMYLRTVINYIEGIIRNINNRTFNIKNAIEWKKFTQGSI